MEILLTTILCFISALVLAYTVVVLYRCICTRNYAEWRASWFTEKSEESGDDQVLLEAQPVVLEGHQQEIECIATDGTSIVSACLGIFLFFLYYYFFNIIFSLVGGQLKVWDNSTGELLTQINRKLSFEDIKAHDSCLELDDNLSDYESGSPPSRDETFPKLLNRINTDFSHIKDFSSLTSSDSKYNFNKSYRHYYFNHDYDVKLRNCEKAPKRQSIGDNLRGTLSESNSEVNTKRNSVNGDKVNFSRESSSGSNFNATGFSPVWCMDYVDNLIVIGCADGRLEFWEGTTGKLKVNPH